MALLFLVMSSIWYRGQIISHATQILATNAFETRPDPTSKWTQATSNCDRNSSSDNALAEMSRRSVRFALWKHGIDALLTSPVVGLGPGAYSGITKPFDGIEAHNSLIDWGTNTGIVGVVLFAALILSLLKMGWRNRNFVGIIGIFSLLMFAQFHYVFRQPIFWFYLLVFSAGAESSAISVADDQPQALQPR